MQSTIGVKRRSEFCKSGRVLVSWSRVVVVGMELSTWIYVLEVEPREL